MQIKYLRKYMTLLKNAQDKNKDHRPLFKFYMPLVGCVWLLTELDPNDFRTAYGLCDLGIGAPELGYVDLKELLDNDVMIDPDFEGQYPISVYARAAQAHRRVIEEDAVLNAFVPKPQQPTYRPS